MSSSGQLHQVCQKLANYCETLPHQSWDKRSSTVDWAEKTAKYEACAHIGVPACYKGITELDAVCMKEVSNIKTDLEDPQLCDKMWSSFSGMATSAVKDVCPAIQKIDPQSGCKDFNINVAKDPITGGLLKTEFMTMCGKDVAQLDKQLDGKQICSKLEDKLGQYLLQYLDQHHMQ